MIDKVKPEKAYAIACGNTIMYPSIHMLKREVYSWIIEKWDIDYREFYKSPKKHLLKRGVRLVKIEINISD